MAFRRERLRVETARAIIVGVLQLPTEGYGSRVTDYLNAHESDFIAVTDVTITPHDGGASEEHDYCAVNLRHAITVLELESLDVSEKPIAPLLTAVPGSIPPPSASA